MVRSDQADSKDQADDSISAEGLYPTRGARARDDFTTYPVACVLAAHPAAVLISFAWLRKVPHGVVAVAAQRKQGGA